MGELVRRGRLTFFLLLVSCILVAASACSSESTAISPMSTTVTKRGQQVTTVVKPSPFLEAEPFKEPIISTSTGTPYFIRPTPVATIASQSIVLSPGTLLLATNLGHELILIDASTGIERDFFRNRIWADFVEWRENGCHLVVRNEYGDYHLVNILGEWIETLFSYSLLEKPGVAPYGNVVSFSPDYDWIWFWHVDGRPYDEMGPESRYEVQDIYIISSDVKLGPFKITRNGGGWLAEWSPDGEKIAFTDYDSSGTAQVYVSTIKGQDYARVTNFDKPSTFDELGTDIDLIDWSPDGKHLAITYTNPQKERRNHATIILNPENAQAVYELKNSRFLWWIDESTFLLEALTDQGTKVIYSQSVGTSVEGPLLLEADYPNIRQIHSFVAPHLVGFFALVKDWQFFVFNSIDGSVTSFPWIGMPTDLLEWVATPATFPGIENCGK